MGCAKSHHRVISEGLSIVVAGPQAVTMSTSCCFRYEEVNGVIILRHLVNIFTTELDSSFFQAAKVGDTKGV